jgi:hypothetical protein
MGSIAIPPAHEPRDEYGGQQEEAVLSGDYPTAVVHQRGDPD